MADGEAADWVSETLADAPPPPPPPPPSECFYLIPAMFCACLALKYFVWGMRTLVNREPEGAAELKAEIQELKVELKTLSPMADFVKMSKKERLVIKLEKKLRVLTGESVLSPPSSPPSPIHRETGRHCYTHEHTATQTDAHALDLPQTQLHAPAHARAHTAGSRCAPEQRAAPQASSAEQTPEEQLAAGRRATVKTALKYGGGPMSEVFVSTAIVFIFWGSKVACEPPQPPWRHLAGSTDCTFRRCCACHRSGSCRSGSGVGSWVTPARTYRSFSTPRYRPHPLAPGLPTQ